MEGIKANFKAATRSTLPHVAFLRLFIVGRNSEVDDFQSLVRSCAPTSTAVSAVVFSPPVKVAVFCCDFNRFYAFVSIKTEILGETTSPQSATTNLKECLRRYEVTKVG